MEIITVIVPLAVISFLFVLVNFIFFALTGKIKTRRSIWEVLELWTVLILPMFFLSIMDLNFENDCCNDSAIFSPEHRFGIYLLILFSIMAYSISIFRKEIFAPIAELLINLFLILGLVLNILLCIHLNTTEAGPFWWFFGNVPIILLLFIKLTENQIRLKKQIEESYIPRTGMVNEICYSILNLNPIYKFPILLILIVPIVILFSLTMILFGQKPDSIIRAFTDTYKHGFSQLDYMCDNVECGGHFLCSVGANGHKNIVKPIRYGERNGRKIICNRQLLISNAFEELVQEKLPKSHELIRTQYNRVGDFIHKYYDVFNIKIISDVVYILMKPLEWIFLLALYMFDKKPENRIAVQYLNKVDREKIKEIINPPKG